MNFWGYFLTGKIILVFYINIATSCWNTTEVATPLSRAQRELLCYAGLWAEALRGASRTTSQSAQWCSGSDKSDEGQDTPSQVEMGNPNYK